MTALSFVWVHPYSQNSGCDNRYMQCEVSMTVCMSRIANQREVPKWLPFKNYKSELQNI